MRWRSRLRDTPSVPELEARGDVKALVHALRADDEARSDAAGTALERIGEPAVAALVEALGTGLQTHRFLVLGVLGAIGGPEAIGALSIEFRRFDPARDDVLDLLSWSAAAHSLAYAGDATILPRLVACLEYDDLDVRQDAASALGVLGDRRAVPGLVRRLETEDRCSDMVDPFVVRALRRIGGEEARRAVRRWERTGGPDRRPPTIPVRRVGPREHLRSLWAGAPGGVWPASGGVLADVNLSARALLTRRERASLGRALSVTSNPLDPAEFPVYAVAAARLTASKEMVLICVTPHRMLIADRKGALRGVPIEAIREARSHQTGRRQAPRITSMTAAAYEGRTSHRSALVPEDWPRNGQQRSEIS
jgi:hypothetical protein